ncbi:MAG: hypothetical protein DRO40_08785 [Thermoprotei archaeon]|nr:MAG: hypothetical protein DRO40_08785 [Thermoprotei archaeon]
MLKTREMSGVIIIKYSIMTVNTIFSTSLFDGILYSFDCLMSLFATSIEQNLYIGQPRHVL